MIYRYRWLLLITFITGFIILLLPDKGQPVIRLNNAHGPSIQDLAGLLLMTISWLFSTFFIIQSLHDLKRKFGKRLLLSMIAAYLLSIIGIITGLNSSIEWILWLSVAFATTINILFIISAFKPSINKA